MTDHQPALQQAFAAQQAGGLDQAERLYRRILAKSPRNAEAHHGLGLVLRDRGEAAAARRSLRRAIELNPRAVNACFNLGRLCLAQRDPHEARIHLESAVALKPEWIDARILLALALTKVQAPALAERLLRETAMRAPDNPHIGVMIANTLMLQGRGREAGPFLEDAAKLIPAHPALLLQQAWCARWNGDFATATALCRQLIGLEARNEQAWTTLAMIALEDESAGAAMSIIDQGASHCPSSLDVSQFRAWITFLDRGAEEGWACMRAWLHMGAILRGVSLHLPETPSSLAGRDVVIESDQGFGDSLHYVRYLPRLVTLGARVVYVTTPPLKRLLRQSELGISIAETGSPTPKRAQHLPEAALPVLFSASREALMAPEAYLKASAADVGRWRDRIGDEPGLRVGVVWAGNPSHFNDCNRSMPVDALRPIVACPRVRLFSLQLGPRQGELAALAPESVVDLAPDLVDFAETAAVIEALDLVITVDTSLAHLAGALGRPVWLLLPRAPDWRWGLEGEQTDLYPSMRLFRQSTPRDWAGVIEQVGDALQTMTMS